MFNKYWKILSLLLILLLPVCAQAQDIGFPEDGENPPGEVPIDGGVGFLVAAGVAYGIKKAKASKDRRDEEDKTPPSPRSRASCI
jgi:hypothetical protein